MDHTPGGECEMRSPARRAGGASGSCGLRLCLGSNVDSAVDIECLAGDVVAVLDQEAHSAGYLVWLTEAPEGDALEELLLGILGDRGYHIRLYEARADRVDGDAVAGELLGRRLREAQEARLGCRVVSLADVASLPHEGAHVD